MAKRKQRTPYYHTGGVLVGMRDMVPEKIKNYVWDQLAFSLPEIAEELKFKLSMNLKEQKL